MNYRNEPIKSLSDFKSRSVFVKAGKVMPRSMATVTPRKYAHRVTVGSNQWMMFLPKGTLVFVEHHDGQFKSVLKGYFKSAKVSINGKPHTCWLGNNDGDYDRLIIGLNNQIAKLSNNCEG